MERDIKPTYDELESYVENLQKQLADAQATIAALQAVIRQMGEQAAVLAKDGMAAKAQVAALQARVNELCKFRQADHEQLVEVQKYWRESQDEVHELRSQLTQRTVELKAAKREWDHAKKMEVVQKEVADNQTWHVQQLRAELERVRAERDRLALCGHDHSTQWWQVRYEDLASLVAALPKEPYSLEFARHTSFYEPLQALTQHRQGMEG